MTDTTTILKVIVGSQAHGLAGPESDYDYRGVFVVPTSRILSLGGGLKHTNWIEGNDDDTAWEIGHFLHLATHCNPTILETFLAPKAPQPDEPLDLILLGDELRSLFPFIWNSVDVRNAFVGYGLNQRKKFLERKDARPSKYATAYLRVLYQAWELLRTGAFTVRIVDTEIGETLLNFRAGIWSVGDVIQRCFEWEQRVNEAFEQSPKKEADLRPVNDFLLRVRKELW